MIDAAIDGYGQLVRLPAYGWVAGCGGGHDNRQARAYDTGVVILKEEEDGTQSIVGDAIAVAGTRRRREKTST